MIKNIKNKKVLKSKFNKANIKNNDKYLGNLLFFKRYSNLFLVLTNNKMKHLKTITSGLCKVGKNKKKKISPFNMLNLVMYLKSQLLKNDIRFLNFFLKQRFSRHFFSLKKMFKLNDIKVSKYIFLLYKSHSLSKKRSIRRI